ncbi:glycine cleavage system T protein [mine drainage metagenome]|uniref:aminomethyltransferase n=2 Tax=mine drainage metagenome TaxID=410659 RepID=T1AWR0_9ZZZZ
MSGPTVAAPPPRPTEPLHFSPLAEFHRRHGGHMVPFAGWQMPLYFSSILAEHRAVREGVGLFDVSHMGILTVDGASAADLLSRRTTADIGALAPGQVRYTFFLEGTGAIVDDLLVSRLDAGATPERRFLVVPNAGPVVAVEEILRQHRAPDTQIARWNGSVAILAVQGPGARTLLERTFGWDLGRLGFYRLAGFPDARGASPSPGRGDLRVPADLTDATIVSRTGYTGERGYELFLRAEVAVERAEALVAAGAVPCGLGARDTLRLEQGYLLSGQEFHRDRTPLEAGQERFVDFDHPFVGRPALLAQRAAGPTVRLAGLVTDAPGAVPRHGTTVESGGEVVATVTSGGRSPTLGVGLALAFLPAALAAPGTEVTLRIRDRTVPARVTALPFRRPPA